MIRSIRLLSDSIGSFNDHCLIGIQVNEKKLRENVEKSLMLATALNPVIGYERASQIAKKAYSDDVSLRQAARELSILDPEEFDKLVKPEAMLKPRE